MQKWFDTFQRILFTGASITVLAIALNHSTSTRPQGMENIPSPITAAEQAKSVPVTLPEPITVAEPKPNERTIELPINGARGISQKVVISGGRIVAVSVTINE